MQKLWMVGIALAALVGSGAVMGMGIWNDNDNMHGRMHDEDYDCWENNNCQLDHEECEDHTEEYCEEEHEDCDYHHTEFYGCC